MIRYDVLSYDHVPEIGESAFPSPAIRRKRPDLVEAYRFIRYAVVRYGTVRYSLAVRGITHGSQRRGGWMSHKLGSTSSQFVGHPRHFIPNLGTSNPKSWDVKSQFVGHNIPICGTFNPDFPCNFNVLQNLQAFITLLKQIYKKATDKRDGAALAKASAVCFISLSSYNSKSHVIRGGHV